MSYCCTQKVDEEELFSDSEDEDWNSNVLGYLEFTVHGEQKRCEVVKGENVIGRELDAQNASKIIIDDITVSSNHARISAIDGNSFLLTDLKSTNGTQIDQLLLTDAFRQYELRSGSTVRFGRVEAKFSSCIPSLTEIMPTSSASIKHSTTISPFVFARPLGHSLPTHQTVPTPILTTALTPRPFEETLKETTNDLKKIKDKEIDELLDKNGDKSLGSSLNVFSDVIQNEKESVKRNGNWDQNENNGIKTEIKVGDENGIRDENENGIEREIGNKSNDENTKSEKGNSNRSRDENQNGTTYEKAISSSTINRNFADDEIYRLMLAEAQKPRADILLPNSFSQEQIIPETTETMTARGKIFDIPISPIRYTTPTNNVNSSTRNLSTSRIKKRSMSTCVTPKGSSKKMISTLKKASSSHKKRKQSDEYDSFKPDKEALCCSSANTPIRKSLRLSAKRPITYWWQLVDDEEDEENIPLLQLKERLKVTDN